jgi:hypothetical protein
VSGWLVGLPFTSGPVTLFVGLEHGAAFAAATAAGTLTGSLAQAAFCLAYAAAAGAGWPLALGAGSLAFALAGGGLAGLAVPLPALTVAVALGLLGAFALLPAPARDAPPPGPWPRWDLPARMLLATALVLALTGGAATLGGRLTGLLSAYPVYAGTLTVFAQGRSGAGAALAVLRGLLLGLFAFSAFFVAVAALAEGAGLAAAFATAVGAALVLQAVSLRVVRRR